MTLEHAGFDEFWAPYLGGVGPAGGYVAGLDRGPPGRPRRTAPRAPARRSVQPHLGRLGGARAGLETPVRAGGPEERPSGRMRAGGTVRAMTIAGPPMTRAGWSCSPRCPSSGASPPVHPDRRRRDQPAVLVLRADGDRRRDPSADRAVRVDLRPLLRAGVGRGVRGGRDRHPVGAPRFRGAAPLELARRAADRRCAARRPAIACATGGGTARPDGAGRAADRARRGRRDRRCGPAGPTRRRCSRSAVVVVGYAVGPAILPAASAGCRRWRDGRCRWPCPRRLRAVAALQRPAAMPSADVARRGARAGVVCTAAAFLAFAALIDEIGPVRATVITYVNPAVAAVLGVLVLRRDVHPRHGHRVRARDPRLGARHAPSRDPGSGVSAVDRRTCGRAGRTPPRHHRPGLRQRRLASAPAGLGGGG